MGQDNAADENTLLPTNSLPRYDRNSEGPQENNTDNTPIEKKKSFWSDASRRQKMIFVLITYGHTAVFMCVSTPFAFMANYIVAKGGVKADAALVVELVMLTMALSSAFFGKYQVIVGTKKLFWSGILCFGVSQALFGVLQFAPNATTIVVVGSIIKIIQGCGQGAYLVAALTIICQEFPDNAATAFGIAETFASIGYTSGPLLGSVFFSISGGILFPFMISILLLIPLIPTSLYFVKDYNATKDTDDAINGFDLITRPGSILVLGMAVAAFGIFGTSDVLATVYLTGRGFSTIEVGLALVVVAGAFGISTFLVAFICDIGTKSRRTVLTLGYLGMCGIPFALTPTQTKVGAYIAMAVFGIFAAFALISSFGELLHLAVGDRPELRTSFALHSALSGVWNLAYGGGVFVYPLIGASLLQVAEYQFALLIVFAIGLVLAVAGALVTAIWQCCAKASTNTTK